MEDDNLMWKKRNYTNSQRIAGIKDIVDHSIRKLVSEYDNKIKTFSMGHVAVAAIIGAVDLYPLV